MLSYCSALWCATNLEILKPKGCMYLGKALHASSPDWACVNPTLIKPTSSWAHAAPYQSPPPVPKFKNNKERVKYLSMGLLGRIEMVAPFFLTALFLLNNIPVCRCSVLRQIDGAIVLLDSLAELWYREITFECISKPWLLVCKQSWDYVFGMLKHGGIQVVQVWPFQGLCVCFGETGVPGSWRILPPAHLMLPGRLLRGLAVTGDWQVIDGRDQLLALTAGRSFPSDLFLLLQCPVKFVFKNYDF